MGYYGGFGMNGMNSYGNGMNPYSPYAQPSPQLPPPDQQPLIMVNGEEGARAYPLPPNKVVPLFDKNRQRFYLKTTDGGGYGSIRVFDYTEIVDSVPAIPAQNTDAAQPQEYLTRAEFEAWKKEQYGERISTTGPGKRKAGSGSAGSDAGDQ